jgi:hypothetical protein
MRALRILIPSVALGLGLAIGVLTPAHAAEPTPVARAAEPNSVIGESWSSPAYPVDCRESSDQITCTPTAPAEVTAQTCYMWVLYDGDDATVCTTYDGHADALERAGGSPTLVQYGCSVGDVVCVTFENAGRGMAMSATAMMYAVAANMRFDTSSLLWDAASGEWSFWAWAILIVTLGSMIWAVTAAVVSGDRSEVVGAILRSFIAVAAVPIMLWLTGHLLNAVDDMTWYIMNRDGPATLFATLQSVMWAGGQANYFFAFLIHGLLMLGMLLLMLVFTFRNIALAALIAVGPVAWMLFPVRGVGPQWVARYVSAVIVLLLTGPLTIGFVTLIINGLSAVTTIWDPQAWPLLFGLALVAFAPFAIFGLFSFVGAVAADGVGSRLGSHAGSLGGRAARTAVAIPSRLGGKPAGIAPSASAGAARRISAGSGTTSTLASAASSPKSRAVSSTSGARSVSSRPPSASSVPPPSSPSSPRAEGSPS